MIIFEVSSKKHGPQSTIDYFTFLYDRRLMNFELIDAYKLDASNRSTFERNFQTLNLSSSLDDVSKKILSDLVASDPFYDPEAELVSAKIFSKANNFRLYKFKYYFPPDLNYTFEFIEFRY